jgi:ACS family glucarate transporter-like MFS transporter
MRNRWFLVALIFAGILISYVDRTNLGIAVTALMHDFSMGPSAAGTLLSAFFWTYASASMALSRCFNDFLALRLLLGVAETVGPLASLSYIRSHFSGSEQGLPTSIYIAGQTVGPACAALAGSMLLAHFGWRWMFAATGVGGLFWVPLWIYSCEPRSSSPQTRTSSSSHKINWKVLTANPSFWILPACVFFFSYYWYFVLTWMPAYLSIARSYSTLKMGTVLSIPLFAMAGTNIGAGWAADRLARRSGRVFGVRLIFACAGLLGASAILFLNVLPNPAVLPVLILSICSFGTASSNFWAIAQHTAPGTVVGRVIGYLNTISSLGGVVAPLITGWSLGPRQNFTAAILLAGAAPLISLLLLWLMGEKRLERLKLELSSSAEPRPLQAAF